MAKESSAISLTSNYYIRNYYRSNKNFCKTSTRKEQLAEELSFEDAKALRRAVRQLSSFGYNDLDNRENMNASIEAYVDTFNNTVTAGSDSSDRKIKQYANKLKNLAAKHSDDLKAVGITAGADGKLSCNTSLLKSASVDKLKKVFGKDTAFMRENITASRKLHANSREALLQEITKNGTIVDVSL